MQYSASMREFGEILRALRSMDWDEFQGEMDSHYRGMPKETYLHKDGKTRSLRKAAHTMGISKNTLNDYELGKRYPSAEFVYDYCAALGVSAEKLISKWVRCHPNPNVSKYWHFGHINRFFLNANQQYLGYERYNSVRFIREAIRKAMALVDTDNQTGIDVQRLTGHQIGWISSVSAAIIDKTLVEGLAPHPKSIEYSMEYEDIGTELKGVIDELRTRDWEEVHGRVVDDLKCELDVCAEENKRLETERDELKVAIDILNSQFSLPF